MSIARHRARTSVSMCRIGHVLLIAFTAILLLAACDNPSQADPGGEENDEPDFDFEEVDTNVPEDERNETFYQFFYWDAYEGLWSDIADPSGGRREDAERLAAAGVTGVWLPPAAKAWGGTGDVGYAVYDVWDLGEFDQKGTVSTRYGTRSQLKEAVSTLADLGVESYFDVVFNHRMGGDETEVIPRDGDKGDIEAWTVFNLAGREEHYDERWGDLYHDFDWNWRAFNGVDYWGKVGEGLEEQEETTFERKLWPDTFSDPYLMGTDVDYWYRPDGDDGPFVIRDEMKAWGEWIIDDIGFSGFRLDAIVHVPSEFTQEWADHVQQESNDDLTFIAEAWVPGDEGEFLDDVGSDSLDAFDFELRGEFTGEYGLTSGEKDMRWWDGLVNSEHGDRAVTFVDNHDTNREGNPYFQPQIDEFKMQAYAYILLHDRGVPTVYARDFDEAGLDDEIEALIRARTAFAYGEVNRDASTEEVHSVVFGGHEEYDDTGLVALISGRDSGGTEEIAVSGAPADTEFEDFTGNVSGTRTTDSDGEGTFEVQLTESAGWSVWVPVE